MTLGLLPGLPLGGPAGGTPLPLDPEEAIGLPAFCRGGGRSLVWLGSASPNCLPQHCVARWPPIKALGTYPLGCCHWAHVATRLPGGSGRGCGAGGAAHGRAWLLTELLGRRERRAAAGTRGQGLKGLRAGPCAPLPQGPCRCHCLSPRRGTPCQPPSPAQARPEGGAPMWPGGTASGWGLTSESGRGGLDWRGLCPGMLLPA